LSSFTSLLSSCFELLVEIIPVNKLVKILFFTTGFDGNIVNDDPFVPSISGRLISIILLLLLIILLFPL
jgi:hypothetical protein